VIRRFRQLKGMMMTVAITWLELTESDLRKAARQTDDANAARRMLAIAFLLEGWSREAAAEACGMERQTLCDWVHRYNASGLNGLYNRPGTGDASLTSSSASEQPKVRLSLS
jgi:transposase